jgi:hypothetical protein
MAIVRVYAVYDVPAAVLWRHVVRYDVLEALMSGPLVRVTCPTGEEQAGHDFVLAFKLFGVIPVSRWRLRVVARDDAALRLRSEESGAGVRRWHHEIAVEPIDGATSRLTDTIEIDAGALTPLVAWFARREYARRHRLRKRMVETAPPK